VARNPGHVDALQAIADRRAPAIRRAFVEAVSKMQTGDLRRQLDEAVNRGALDEAFRLAADAWRAIAEADLQIQIAEQVLQTLQQAGRETEQEITRVSRTFRAARGVQTAIRFDITNPLAVDWARTRSASLVRQITADQEAVLRQVIARATAGELNPRQVTREIQQTVGLLPQQEQAAATFRRELQALAGRDEIGSLNLRGRRVSNRGLTASKIEDRVDAYRERLRRQRAEAISRTELQAAANEGQLQSWTQARAKGQIPPSMEKQWLTTPDDRTCPLCLPLDGQSVPIDQPFRTALGPKMTPPLHPLCRCAMTLGEPRGRRSAA
jgi:SPP1 gp7 family putative phage head morphogenesis protein